MKQMNKNNINAEKSFKDEKIRILNIQYVGEFKKDNNQEHIDNGIFIVELIKKEKDSSGKDIEKRFKRYYLGNKCIGADIGDNNPIFSETVKDKDVIDKKIKEEKQEEAKKIKNIKAVQKIRMDKKVDSNESLAERLDMKGYTDLYVVNSSDIKDTKSNNKNEINNSQYSLIAITSDGNAEIVNDKFCIDRDSQKVDDNAAIKIQANGVVKEDNKDSIQLRRKTNDSVLGIKNEYDNLRMFLYEKDIKNDNNVGIELETVNMVKNGYVVNKNKGIYNSTNIAEETKGHLNNRCNPDNPKDYDGDLNTNTHLDYNRNIDPDDCVPNTKITWKQFATMCGYRGEGAIEKAAKEFYSKKESNKEIDNETITNEIVEEKEEEYHIEGRKLKQDN